MAAHKRIEFSLEAPAEDPSVLEEERKKHQQRCGAAALPAHSVAALRACAPARTAHQPRAVRHACGPGGACRTCARPDSLPLLQGGSLWPGLSRPWTAQGVPAGGAQGAARRRGLHHRHRHVLTGAPRRWGWWHGGVRADGPGMVERGGVGEHVLERGACGEHTPPAAASSGPGVAAAFGQAPWRAPCWLLHPVPCGRRTAKPRAAAAREGTQPQHIMCPPPPHPSTAAGGEGQARGARRQVWARRARPPGVRTRPRGAEEARARSKVWNRVQPGSQAHGHGCGCGRGRGWSPGGGGGRGRRAQGGHHQHVAAAGSGRDVWRRRGWTRAQLPTEVQAAEANSRAAGARRRRGETGDFPQDGTAPARGCLARAPRPLRAAMSPVNSTR